MLVCCHRRSLYFSFGQFTAESAVGGADSKHPSLGQAAGVVSSEALLAGLTSLAEISGSFTMDCNGIRFRPQALVKFPHLTQVKRPWTLVRALAEHWRPVLALRQYFRFKYSVIKILLPICFVSLGISCSSSLTICYLGVGDTARPLDCMPL